MYENYIKKTVQRMRPYVPGEDLTGISVSAEDTPEEGGMIAINPKNPDDKWYVGKKFFQENYIGWYFGPNGPERIDESVPVPVPTPKSPEPLPPLVEKLFDLLIKRTEKEEERFSARKKLRESDERRSDSWFYQKIADLYERRAELLEKAKKSFEKNPDDISGCAASDAAVYILKAIEEEKRIHAKEHEQ